MPYPGRYVPGTDFSQEEDLGIEERGAKLDTEFFNIREITNQLNDFIRSFTTANGKLNLDAAVRVLDVITIQTANGDGSSPQTIPFDVPIDSGVDLVRTYVDGVRVTPVGYDDNEVQVNTTVGTNNVEIRIYTNLAGVLDRIQDLVADTGASYVGFADPGNNYAASDVESALNEVKTDLDTLITNLGDLASYVLRDGSRTLTGQWDVNEQTEVIITPVAATGSLEVTANPADTDTITINDGVNTFTFEFESGGGVSGSNVPVNIGGSALITGASLVSAINNSPLAITAVGVDNGAQHDITLTHQVPGTVGNETIAATGAWYSNLLGMSGGVDGSFSGALKTYFRIRNHPRSLADGDVVVHEQLGEVLSQVTAILAAFLRVDGGNSMTSLLNFGGNRGVNMADAIDLTDATTLQQVRAEIAGDFATNVEPRLDLSIQQDGTANAGGTQYGTLTGPATFNRAAGDVADADQVTSPGTVTVPTLHGIPTPAADDHVSNKKYVDDEVAAALGSVPSVGAYSSGSGGSASITNPGIWVVHAIGSAEWLLTDNVENKFLNGFCIVANGSIVHQSTVILHESGAQGGIITTNAFSVSGGGTTINFDVTAGTSGTQVFSQRVMAFRIS